MQPEFPKSRQDLYREFIEFIRSDIQRERHLVNRRMFSAFIWCFAVPALASATLLFLINFRVLPMKARAYLDWLVLIFPVSYSLYILGSEVLAQVPATFRRGGVASALGQTLKEAEWRERVCEIMTRSLKAGTEDWQWIVANFRVDLRAMQYRTRYLTALAGAVFFLLMQGIDTLSGSGEPPVTWAKSPILGWVEMSSYDFSQFVGLTLFLVLLYLSGNQTYHSLMRYLHCAELNLLGSPDPSKGPKR